LTHLPSLTRFFAKAQVADAGRVKDGESVKEQRQLTGPEPASASSSGRLDGKMAMALTPTDQPGTQQAADTPAR
jgi:hypothetical protein